MIGNKELIFGTISSAVPFINNDILYIPSGFISTPSSVNINSGGGDNSSVIINVANTVFAFDTERGESGEQSINAYTDNGQQVYYFCESLPNGFSLSQTSGTISFSAPAITSGSFEIMVFSPNAITKTVAVTYNVSRPIRIRFPNCICMGRSFD